MDLCLSLVLKFSVYALEPFTPLPNICQSSGSSSTSMLDHAKLKIKAELPPPTNFSQ